MTKYCIFWPRSHISTCAPRSNVSIASCSLDATSQVWTRTIWTVSGNTFGTSLTLKSRCKLPSISAPARAAVVVIGEGGQCKVCKHPYCMSCDESMFNEPLCDFCDQDILCGRSACRLGGEIPYMDCDSCDLMFCEGCSQKDEVPGVLICVGSDDREGCFKRMCEICAKGPRRSLFHRVRRMRRLLV